MLAVVLSDPRMLNSVSLAKRMCSRLCSSMQQDEVFRLSRLAGKALRSTKSLS